VVEQGCVPTGTRSKRDSRGSFAEASATPIRPIETRRTRPTAQFLRRRPGSDPQPPAPRPHGKEGVIGSSPMLANLKLKLIGLTTTIALFALPAADALAGRSWA